MRLELAGVLPLRDAGNRASCGGKAASLARIIHLGLPTANGHVILNSAFQNHLAHCDSLDLVRSLRSKNGPADDNQWKGLGEAIRHRITNSALEPGLALALRHAYGRHWRGKRLAVRSSSVDEDGAAASFAGLLDTCLNVDSLSGLEFAVKQVWSSLFSERNLQYAQHRSIVPTRMGVIVQEQIDAAWAGVLFTRDPMDAAREEMLVEFCRGLGDKLVSGVVTPGRVRISRDKLSIRFEQKVPAEADGLPTPSSEALASLAEMGLALERGFEGPQDVEWCINERGRPMVLQSRPITAFGNGEARAMVAWSNANIAENFPDPVSPFLYSIVRQGYTAYFRNLAVAFGFSPRRIAAMAESLETIVGAHCGRLYYNLSSIHSVLYFAPGGLRLARFFNDFTGAGEFPNPPRQVLPPWAKAFEVVKVGASVLWQYLWIHARVAEFERTVDEFADRTQPLRLERKSLMELDQDLRDFLDIRFNRWKNAGLADTAAMVCYGLLKGFLAKNLPERPGTGWHNDLLKGLPGLVSSIPVTRLWELSRKIRQHRDLLEVFQEADAGTIRRKLQEPRFAVFREALDEYFEKWGFRYSGELMLTHPTPQEDPVPILRLLRTYADQGEFGPEEISQAQARAREAATREIAKQLTPFGLARRLPLVSRASRFLLLLRATQGAIRLRERARMKQALLYTRLRHVALKIGEHLARRGQLECREDIFYLAHEEVRQLIAGQAYLNDQIARIVAIRKQAHEGFLEKVLPDSFVLPWGEQYREHRTDHAAASPSPDGAIQGCGACGGRIEGPAAVILDVVDADRLRPGDILVTRQTDPGWASVFFLVKGLVIERGGMLSHGAIIAREYGIPAVIGVANATREIRNGDRVQVDGDHGIVRIVKPCITDAASEILHEQECSETLWSTRP